MDGPNENLRLGKIKEVIEATTVEGFDRIYFLGPFARRVSFASQQQRVLNLIWALTQVDTPHHGLKPGHHVAVIGGGLAGLTACAALISAKCIVTLFESNAVVLDRIRSAGHRFIHPTINLWPFEHLNPTTAFPFLDWYSDPCDLLVQRLEREWNDKIVGKMVEPNNYRAVEGFDTSSPVTLSVRSLGPSGKPLGAAAPISGFQAAIVTTGFGEERELKKFQTSSYWKSHVGRTGTDILKSNFLISGIGDGGLIDTIYFTYKNFQNGKFIVDVAERVPLAIAERVKTAEVEAREKPDKHRFGFLEQKYQDIYPLLPKDFLAYLDGSLWPRTEPTLLVSRAPSAYSAFSAPIHKLLITHALLREKVRFVRGTLKREKSRVFVKQPDNSELSCSKYEVVARHGASNTLSKFLGRGHPLAELKRKQMNFMDNHDKHFWPLDYFRITGYPPHNPKDKSFVKSRYEDAVTVAKRYSGVKGLTPRADGFQLVLKDSSELPEVMPTHFFGVPVIGNPLIKSKVPEGDFSSGSVSPTFDDIALESGVDVRAREAQRSGRLTCLVVDEKQGELFGVTARHVIQSDTPPVVSGLQPVEVGRYDAATAGSSASAERSIVDDIGLFSVSPEVFASPGYFVARQMGPSRQLAQGGTIEPRKCSQIREVADMWNCLGEEVFLAHSKFGVRHGYVSAIHAPVRFRDEHGNSVEFRDAVEIERLGHVPFSVPGDSGALVVDKDGRALGLVIGVAEGRTYVAPLCMSDLFKTYRFMSIRDEVAREKEYTFRSRNEDASTTNIDSE